MVSALDMYQQIVNGSEPWILLLRGRKENLGFSRAGIVEVDQKNWAVCYVNPAGSCLEWLHCLGDFPYNRLNSRLN